jgi:hypothetical protein
MNASLSRPTSPARPDKQDANSKKSEPFRVSGKMAYEDMFLQFKEEEMLGAQSRGVRSVRDQLIKSAEGPTLEEQTEEKAAMNMVAWDDSESKESEKMIKTLRANLKEQRETAEALKARLDMLLTEKTVMTELLHERKLMAEKSLALAAKLQADYDHLMGLHESGGSGAGDEASGAEGFSSWRNDRARLGRKLEETEARNAQLLSEQSVSANLVSALQAQLENMDNAEKQRRNEQIVEITNLRCQISAAEALAAEERSAREVLTKAQHEQADIADYLATLKGTNNKLIEQMEFLKTEHDITLNSLSSLEKQLKSLQDGLEIPSEDAASQLQLQLVKEIKNSSELSARVKQQDADILKQSKTIVDNANHIEKLQEAIEEKNGMNAECREIIKSLEESAARLQADLEGKMTLIVEQQDELGRMHSAADVALKRHEAQQNENRMTIEVKEREILHKREKVIALEREIADTNEAHRNSFANTTKIQEDLKEQLNKAILELNTKKEALVDWEKKMSLFEIMQEMDTEAKVREENLQSQLSELNASRLRDRVDADMYLHNWKQVENQLRMIQADDLLPRLLDERREAVRTLRVQVKSEQDRSSDLLAEIHAINGARELEQLEFEKREKLSLRNVSDALRTVNSLRVVETAVLNSKLNSLAAETSAQAQIANNEIAARLLEIDEKDNIIVRQQEVMNEMERLLFEKDTELVRARAENEDFRVKSAQRTREDVVALNSAAIESKKLLTAGHNARAPRLRIAQLEGIIQSTELRVRQWQRIAQEYLLDAPNSFQSQNNEGYAIALSAVDGSVYGVGTTSVLEHMLSNAANNLVATHSVSEPALASLRAWISENNITEEMENRALRNVLLSWSGLEALTDVKFIAERYGTMDFSDFSVDLSASEGPDEEFKPSRNQVMSKDDDFYADLAQRLFSLFELGNSTVSEFRVMRELHLTLGVSVEDISSSLDALNLSMSSCADRAVQDMSDRFELRTVQNTSYDLRIVGCILSAPEMDCSKEFLRNMHILQEELLSAEELREEYAVLRLSYNQACTQIALVQDLNKLSTQDRVSARSARRSPRDTIENSSRGLASFVSSDAATENAGSLAKDGISRIDLASKTNQIVASVHRELHHIEHDHHGSIASVRKTLKKEVSDERNRRYEEARQRGMDFNSVSTMEGRASRLIQRADHNLACLELELAEGGSDIDKSRIVFIKLLRHRLSREASSKGEHSHLATRIKKYESSAETYLVHLEEALAALDLSDANASNSATVTQQDVQSSVSIMVNQHIKDLTARIKKCNSNVSMALEAILAGRDEEVRANSKNFREVEERMKKLASNKAEHANGKHSKQAKLHLDIDSAETLQAKSILAEERTRKTAVALQAQLQVVRRKDAALERMRFLLQTFADNVISLKYKSHLSEIRDNLTNLQIVDESSLGGGMHEDMLVTRLQWNNARIPSLNTLPDVNSILGEGRGPFTAEDFKVNPEIREGVEGEEGEEEVLEPGPETAIPVADAETNSAKDVNTETIVESDSNVGKPKTASSKRLISGSTKNVRTQPPGSSPLTSNTTLATPMPTAATTSGKIFTSAKISSSGNSGNNQGSKGRIYPESPSGSPTSSPSQKVVSDAAERNAAVAAAAAAATAAKDSEDIHRRLELMHEMRTMKQELLNEFQDLKQKPLKESGPCVVM